MIGKLDPEESVMSERVELMYKAPGRKSHQDVTKVLDEIMNRLDRVEEILEEGACRLDVIEKVGLKAMDILELDFEEIREEVD